MTNFYLSFLVSPWLMLLIPVAVALTLIPYFRLAKRYRRTRNRIISITMHLIVSVLCISVLAGMRFVYETPNNDNELVILVDMSESTDNSTSERDVFVDELISDSMLYNCKVGIVAFGFDQKVVSPLSNDVASLKADYKDFIERNSDVEPDGTNIAAAFRAAGNMIKTPESGKVVLISDGVETDESAMSVIRTLTAKGIKIDVIEPSADFEYDNDAEIQICDVTFPQEDMSLNVATTVNVKIKSKTDTAVNIKLYDKYNGTSNVLEEPVVSQDEIVGKGEQEISLKYTFKDEPFHEVKVVVSSARSVSEKTEKNNEFTTFVLIEKFDKLLIIEGFNGNNSDNLASLLKGDGEKVEQLLDSPFKYDVTTVIADSPEYKDCIDNLTAYDQVILNNVANSDLPDGDIEKIRDYVYVYGGGLLTVGGDKDGKVHVYDPNDLGKVEDTTYQDMLPINAINYTPPMGVAFIIDISGSMKDSLEYTKAGLEAVAKYSLTDRDYISIFTLDSVYGQILPLTPRTNWSAIIKAIRSIDGTGGTTATNAIWRASQSLIGSNLASKHIVMLTDGMFGDRSSDGESPYITEARNNYQKFGITLSVIGINMTIGNTDYNECVEMTKAAGGKVYVTNDWEKIGDNIQQALAVKEVTDINEGTFAPVVNKATDPVLNGVERKTVTSEDDKTTTVTNRLDFKLGAFYGGRVKAEATLVLTDSYMAPIYAYWQYGKGRVGSFMSDLKGTDDSHSAGSYDSDSGIFTSKSGQALIFGIVRELMPDTRLVAGEVNCELVEDNFINTLNLYNNLKSNEKLDIKIEKTNSPSFEAISMDKASSDNGSGVYVITPASDANDYSKATFVIKKAGVYKITVTVTDSDGKSKVTEIYKSFSYSAEYEMFAEDETAGTTLMKNIAARSGGEYIDAVAGLNGIYSNFDPVIRHEYDPRFLFIIISIIAFLIDIAVRKFKFKWPHELIREAKEKKEQ